MSSWKLKFQHLPIIFIFHKPKFEKPKNIISCIFISCSAFALAAAWSAPVLGSAQLTGTLNLDAQGDLGIVNVINGNPGTGVYWDVGSSATVERALPSLAT